MVACCERIGQLGNVAVDSGIQLTPHQRKKLRPVLTEGIANGLLPIPKFEGHVPSMVANLRRLDLLKWDAVQAESGEDRAPAGDAGFERVASTDSPFRELVVWAYLRVTGRPGAPEFDVDGWLDAICKKGYHRTGTGGWAETVRAIDLFCGVGGLTSGLRRAGWDVVAGIDVDYTVGPTYQCNNPTSKFVQADLRNLTEGDVLALANGIRAASCCLLGARPAIRSASNVVGATFADVRTPRC